MSFSQLAFSFQGRMRRRDFWIGQILLCFSIGFLSMILIPAAAGMAGRPSSVFMFPTYGGWVFRALLLWPVLAIAVKRGHDRNRPAAWIISLYALENAMNLAFSSDQALLPWALAAELAFVAYVLVDLGLLDGAKGADRFGPSPKTPLVAERAAA